jgi:glycosyltransferase involved in cell wall biosynthesis
LVRDEEELLVRDAAAEFAAAAVRLARNDSDRHRLAIAGLASVSKHYSAEVVRRRRNDIYESIVAARRIETSAEPRFV